MVIVEVAIQLLVNTCETLLVHMVPDWCYGWYQTEVVEPLGENLSQITMDGKQGYRIETGQNVANHRHSL